MKIYPRFFLIIALALCCSHVMHAQDKELQKANKKFKQYAFIDAQRIYLRLAEEGQTSPELFRKLGDSYYFNGLYEDGAKWYGKLVEMYPEETTPEYYFRYAQTLKAAKDYKKSDEIMKKFMELKGTDLRADLFKEEPNYLQGISYTDSDYKVENLRRMNSRYSDFGTTIYEGKLIFASSRDTGNFSKKIHTWNYEPFLDFYEAPIDAETGEVGKPEKFLKDLNTPFHESSAVFTADGNRVYFTRNNYNHGVKRRDANGTTRLKIYTSVKRGDGWSSAKELPFNDDSYSVSHPAISPDGKKLYFSSDMEGSLGQSDIWYVDIKGDDEYGEPQNLGNVINTEGRENFPFLSKKGNLYFSSDGRPGLGGLDVYVAAKDKNGDIAYVINLGEPVNSPQDDFAFIVDESQNKGYFSSNRYYGMGSDDIFSFTREPKPEPVCNTILDVVVKDSETLEPLPNATVILMDADSNVEQTLKVDENGKVRINTDCNVEKLIRADEPDYFSAEDHVVTKRNNEIREVELLLDPRITKVNEGDDLAKLLNLKPIYFDFDRFNIRPDAAIELVKVIAVMETNPGMVVEIRSHTDSRGNDQYNMILSDKRARSTADYIVSRGIERERISGKGFGESQLINKCSNGVECTEEEHQLNRRSEFIVTSLGGEELRSDPPQE